MRRSLLTFATLVVLWVLVSQVNHYLAPIQGYLFVGGLFVTFAAFALSLKEGIVAIVPAGLLCDASAPMAFGTQMLLLVLAFLAIQTIRDRLPRERAVQLLVALIANLALFVAYSLTLAGRAPLIGPLVLRLACDLLYSEIFILLVGPWFFAFQARTLQWARERASAYD